MRKFYLENESGERQALNCETGIFLSNPEGLGFEFGGSFSDIDLGFFKYASKKYNQLTFTATLNFFGNPYELYNQFVNWILQATSLKLVYNPYGMDYYADVELASIKKTEINRYSYLSSEFKLKYLTPWYLKDNQTIETIAIDYDYFRLSADYDISTTPPGEGNGSILIDPSFDYTNATFQFTTDVLAAGLADRYSISVSISGHFAAGFMIEYTGAAYHPVFILENANTGKELGRCTINKDFVDGDKILFSTAYNDSYVKSIDILGIESNLLEFVDLSTDPFFRIPTNTECVLRVEDDGGLNGSVKCIVYDYYRSV